MFCRILRYVRSGSDIARELVKLVIRAPYCDHAIMNFGNMDHGEQAFSNKGVFDDEINLRERKR